MKRFLALPVFAALSVLLTSGARELSVRLEENPRALMLLQRNRQLIQDLVHGGISLAGEADALKRAAYCNSLAKRLAGEIQQAATEREHTRITEMGDHLHALLKRGVAANLTLDRLGTNLGSAREVQIRRVGEDVKNLTKPLESLLAGVGKTDLGELRRTLRTIHDAQVEVEMTVKKRNGR
jgi:hypothetical protein